MERNRREGDGRGKDRARERVERRPGGKMSRVHSLVPWCDSWKCVCVGVGVHALIVYNYTCVSVQR